MVADIISSISAAIQQYNGSLILGLKVAAVLLATYLFRQLFDNALKRRFKNITKQMDINKTSYTVMSKLTGVGIYLLGIGIAIYMVPSLRRLSIGIMASAGFLGIVIGFAAQEAMSNIISGVFIAIFTPFRVGDTINANAQYGTVEDITLRHTVIKTPDNERVIVPNTKILSNDIVNYSIIDEKSRFHVEIPISYRDDIDEAKDIILDEADNHPLTQKDESTVITKNLGDSGVILELRLWSHDRGDAWQAGQDIRESVKKRFDEADITIPFPQRTVSYLDEEDGAV